MLMDRREHPLYVRDNKTTAIMEGAKDLEYNGCMKKTKKRHLRNFIIVFLILVILCWVAVNVLVNAVLVPSFMKKLSAFERISNQAYAEQVQESELQRNAAAMRAVGRVWAKNTEHKEVTVISEDGYKLKGVIFGSERRKARRVRHRWVILLHGYTGSREMMYCFARRYVQEGYSVLAPDFRCQGESEGDFIGLGATDSKDLLKWIDLILEKDPEAEIVLHGLSMGASAALILSGEADAPDCIKVIISDCAYTDAYSMFREKIGNWFHLPAFPIVDIASLMIRLRAGYDLKETSPLNAVAGSHIPTLFIHGQEDRMIPVSMCHELYEAASCEKEIMVVEGAGHAQAAEKDPDEYFSKTMKFINKCLRTE